MPQEKRRECRPCFGAERRALVGVLSHSRRAPSPLFPRRVSSRLPRPPSALRHPRRVSSRPPSVECTACRPPRVWSARCLVVLSPTETRYCVANARIEAIRSRANDRPKRASRRRPADRPANPRDSNTRPHAPRSGGGAPSLVQSTSRPIRYSPKFGWTHHERGPHGRRLSCSNASCVLRSREDRSVSRVVTTQLLARGVER